jgi:hypothetical protein
MNALTLTRTELIRKSPKAQQSGASFWVTSWCD